MTNSETKESQFLKTFTGLKIDVFNPTPEMFSIYDIAHSLSNMPRFAGHTPVFYSVAQHSIAVAKIVEEIRPEWALEALMHDAGEAYVLDLPHPIKYNITGYREMEDHLMEVLFDVFHLKYPYHSIIKEADNLHLKEEMSKSFDFPRVTHEEIEIQFIEEYSRLVNIRLNANREKLKATAKIFGNSEPPLGTLPRTNRD